MVDVEPYVTLEAPSKVRDEQSVLSICAFSKEQTADAKPAFSIQWRPAEKNRLLDEFGLDGFCLISFEKVHPREIVKILTAGVAIGERVFRFIGHSNSQMKSKTCWLYNGLLEENEQILDRVGFFKSITSAAKRAKRVGLLFTSITSSITVSEKFQEDADEDIEANGFCFTDGCGQHCTNFAKVVARELRILEPVSAARYRPSAFQVRFKGYKGMIVEDPSLNQPSAEVVKMRPSQKKFRLQDGVQIQKKFGVVDYSKPYQFGALNKFTIIILSGLGVPLEIFQQRQEDFFRKWALAVDGQTEALMETLLLAKRPELLQELIAKDNVGRDLKPVREALRSELKKMSRQDANNQEPKLRIPIERSRLLFGVADTTDTLKYGECFLQLEGLETPPAARVLVTRSPCYHPGDLRVLRAMPISELVSRAEVTSKKLVDLVEQRLSVLRDVVVFPTQGPRPHPDEMQGGDLDGDEFFVCWDTELLPRMTVDPASYEATAASADPSCLAPLGFGGTRRCLEC